MAVLELKLDEVLRKGDASAPAVAGSFKIDCRRFVFPTEIPHSRHVT